MYGVTGRGGAFELTQGSNGWTYMQLSTFGSTSTAGLTLDSLGNLYGEGNGGEKTDECGLTGCGRVFALHQQPNGYWKQFTLYNFVGSEDGYHPSGGVTLHGSDLYGTTEAGGGNYCFGGCGTVFQLTHGTGKSVNEQIIHAFSENGTPGVFPVGGVVSDGRGDLFGVTEARGTAEDGIIYGLKPQGNGQWDSRCCTPSWIRMESSRTPASL